MKIVHKLIVATVAVASLLNVGSAEAGTRESGFCVYRGVVDGHREEARLTKATTKALCESARAISYLETQGVRHPVTEWRSK